MKTCFFALAAGGVMMAQASAQQLPGAPLGQPEEVPLAPIDAPVSIFPFPDWMVATAAVVGLLVLGLIIWAILAWLRRKPPIPPPLPREVAQKGLETLRARVEEMEPYPFSIEVSDVLRRFVSNAYGVEAVARTSPEFLAEAAHSDRFSEEEKALLAVFLEKSDLIKYARVHATQGDSEQLLEEAFRFLEGGQEQ